MPHTMELCESRPPRGDMRAVEHSKVAAASRRLAQRGVVIVEQGALQIAVAAAQLATAATIADLGGGGAPWLVLARDRWHRLGVASGPAQGSDTDDPAAYVGVRGESSPVAVIAAVLDSGSGGGRLISRGQWRAVEAADGGIYERPAAAEAALYLVRRAGLVGAAIAAPVVAHTDDLQVPRVTLDEVAAAAWSEPDNLRVDGPVRLPTDHGILRGLGLVSPADGGEHLLVWGADDPAGLPIYIDTPCWAGRVFGSTSCDCGPRLRRALSAAAAGRGAVLHLGAGRACDGRTDIVGCGVVGDPRSQGLARAARALLSSPEGWAVPRGGWGALQ